MRIPALPRPHAVPHDGLTNHRPQRALTFALAPQPPSRTRANLALTDVGAASTAAYSRPRLRRMLVRAPSHAPSRSISSLWTRAAAACEGYAATGPSPVSVAAVREALRRCTRQSPRRRRHCQRQGHAADEDPKELEVEAIEQNGKMICGRMAEHGVVRASVRPSLGRLFSWNYDA